jgi:two-component system, OmpR family, aerobic respiration control sensor histidine kinase ArcB
MMDTVQLLQQIVLSVPNYIFWKDKKLVYRGCNYNFAHIVGSDSPADVIGKTDDEMPWGLYTAKVYKDEDEQIITTGEPILDKEVPFQLAVDKKRILSVSKVPLRDNKNRIIGILGIFIDITDRKKMETDLMTAKQSAEAANQAKTEFLENMRHDIRTPLTGIVGFANIIADEIKDPKIKEYVDNLTASSNALLDLLNEILEVIKINSKEIPLLKKKFDLNKRLSDVISLNKSKARHKNIDLLFDYDQNIPSYVIGDPIRIHRIALELIANALNFSEKGFVKLTTELVEAKERELIIKIIVEDTGIGIDPNKREDIFLQFKRLTPSYEGIYKGAGLGLAIVKQFIDELDGEIYLETQIGIGTKFTCIIPLKKPLLEGEFGSDDEIPVMFHKGYDITPKIKAADLSLTETNTAKSFVLLVEDQALTVVAVKNILSSLNCQVDVASDGKTAVQFGRENNYDLIFMDIGLPDMDGYEVTKRIRLFELNKETHIPIITLTAHVDEENKQHCLEVGMNAVISKPLLKEQAADILNSFIPYRKQPKEAKGKAELKQEVSPFVLEGKVIDFKLAKELLGNKKLIYEMLGILVDGFTEELEKLHAAREKEDWPSIQAIAHKLKGGASYCGTTRLKEACLQMEISVKTDKKELFANLYQQMLTEIDAVKEAVRSKSIKE